MTIAQQLRQEGRQEEKHEITMNLLAANVELQTIKKSTDLTDEEITQIHKEQAN